MKETHVKNLLALGAAALIGFAGIGWYLGWYKIQTTPTASGEKVTIDLNTPKIKEDVAHGKEKLRDYLSGDDKTPLPPPPTSSNSNGNSPVTPTGFQRNDSEFVYPASNQTNQPNLPPLPNPR